MFETVIAAMLKHKQIVFAAIAVAALSGMVIVPATQVAQAQLGRDIARDVLDSVFGERDNGDDGDDGDDGDQGDDNQNIDQTQEQENDQDQEADQDVTQTNDQSERNTQANELDTGDNTATV